MNKGTTQYLLQSLLRMHTLTGSSNVLWYYLLQESILCSSEIQNEWNIFKSASCSTGIVLFSSLVVLSSDDEDEPSEPKCTELVQDNITDNKETDEQADCFSAKRLEDNMESHTQQVVQYLTCILLYWASNLSNVYFFLYVRTKAKCLEQAWLVMSVSSNCSNLFHRKNSGQSSKKISGSEAWVFATCNVFHILKINIWKCLIIQNRNDQIVVWARGDHDEDTSVKGVFFHTNVSS